MGASVTEIQAPLLERLARHIGEDNVEMWFADPDQLQLVEQQLEVRADDAFSLERVRQQFHGALQLVARQCAGDGAQVAYRVRAVPADGGAAGPAAHRCGAAPDAAAPAAALRPAPSSRHAGGRLAAAPRPKVELLATFEFGSHAMLQAAVAQVVADPGRFSPLYLHGPVGCGKTHLVRGIVEAIQHALPKARCVCLTAEQFLSDFIEALDGRGVPSFRRRCRGQHVLAIEDVQSLRGKRMGFALTELQNTIDALVHAKHQVIVSGDRPLGEQQFLGKELIQRLACGLTTAVPFPDLPARRRIIERLAASREVVLSADVVEWMAAHLPADVRSLSGGVNQLQAWQLASAEPITTEHASVVLRDLLLAARSIVTLDRIEAEVCGSLGLRRSDLRSERRSRPLSTARSLAMFLARKHTDAPLSDIGEFFGVRSHSTVIAAQRRIEHWMRLDRVLRCGTISRRLQDAVGEIEARLRVS